MFTTVRSALLATAFAGLSLTACQVTPGQYRVYKITELPAVPALDCGVDIDPRDSTKFFSAQTIAIFATEPDDYFLEYGTDVILGTRSGKDYSFFADSVNAEDQGQDGETTITTIRSVKVDLTINGHQINGDYVLFESTTCSGVCDNIEPTACTINGRFFGSEIKDIELERAI